MRVWITRSRLRAEHTARAVADLGHEPLISPLLVIETIAAPIDLDGVGSIAFTSANGVEAFAAQSPRRDLAAYAVGPATADQAREASFIDVRSGPGDAAGLATTIADDPNRPPGRVLWARGREVAFGLARALNELGVETRSAVVYRRNWGAQGFPAAVAETVDAILFHSPAASERFVSRLSMLDLRDRLGRIRALALSDAVAAPLRHLGFADIAVAAERTDAALLDLLARPLGNPPPGV